MRNPVLGAGEKTGGPGENPRKQAWTGNQKHMSSEPLSRNKTVCDLYICGLML